MKLKGKAENFTRNYIPYRWIGVSTDQFRKLMEKLNLIIQLLALNLVRDMKTQKEKIIALHSLGIRPSKIAKLLNISDNYVNVTLSNFRKKQKKNENLKDLEET